MTSRSVAARSSRWRPLLTGESAACAWLVVRDIADALEASLSDLDQDPSLGRGAAGWALFFAYLAAATEEEHYADLAVVCVERMIDVLPSMPPNPGLFSGFTGPGWVLKHLQERLLEPDEAEGDLWEEIDASLLATVRREIWQDGYDLISGLVGFGVYALEGPPRSASRACLRLILEHLERLAESSPETVTWFTPPEHLPDRQRRVFERGYYNLGVAHGVPGIMAFLASVETAGSDPKVSPRLLDRTVAWILDRELDREAGGGFASFVGHGAEPQPARLAWCYGGLGVATALLRTAGLAGREDWWQEAVRIARDAAARPAEESGVVDAGLCHGSAGVGHLFNRLYQATGDEALASAARTWLGYTVKMQRPGEGVGGFLAWWAPNTIAQPDWTSLTGFLEGAAGVGLALLAAVSPLSPDWDRVLLAEVPPALDSLSAA